MQRTELQKSPIVPPPIDASEAQRGTPQTLICPSSVSCRNCKGPTIHSNINNNDSVAVIVIDFVLKTFMRAEREREREMFMLTARKPRSRNNSFFLLGCGGVKFLHIERKITSVVHSLPPSHYIRAHALGWLLVMFTTHRMQNKI